MVAAVRWGRTLRAVARRFKVSLHTVQRWVQRAQGQRLDRVDWKDRPTIPRTTRRTAASLEALVLTVRHELKESSPLGEYGAVAIHCELLNRGLDEVPSIPPLNRILRRHGVFDARHRVRRPPPPRGWYLPDVARGQAELDSFDIVEGLVLQHGPQLEVLTGIAVHGGTIGAWPTDGLTAKRVVMFLLAHWREVGLPTYAQFDNDTRFQGPHHYPDVISSVLRLCLSLDVMPVFVPPREMGFQAAVESFNGRWQAKVWARFHHESLQTLQARSAAYVAASRARAAIRLEAAPARRLFPPQWPRHLQAPLDGQLIFLRRTSAGGSVGLLGRTFAVAPRWPHRLVRCEVDLTAERIRFYALRRREPTWQPLLHEMPYKLIQRSTHA